MADFSGSGREDSRKRKRDSEESDNNPALGEGCDREAFNRAAKRAKPDQPQAEPVVAAKPSKAAALLAKRRAIQEQKQALALEISQVERSAADQITKDVLKEAHPQRTTPGAEALSVSSAPRVASNIPSGNVLLDLESIPKLQSTLKANLRYNQEAAEKKEKKERPPARPVIREAPVMRHPAERKRRNLVFVEPGTYIKKAEEQRAALATYAAPSSNLRAPTSTVPVDSVEHKKVKVEEIVPDVEWWDAPFLENNDFDKVIESKVTNLVDHPVLLEPASEKPPPGPLPLLLTPAERKRLRKKNKAERLKEKQDRIMLGLEPAPKPRVRLANMMRVMGAEAIQDPTAVEKMVRQEMAAREERHKERNESRKLTPEQRREKLINKYKEDTSLKTSVSIFRVESLSSGKHRFKVEMNAQQLQLTGCIISGPRFSVVIAEGGPKGIKKMKKLMSRRIKWEEREDGSEFLVESTGKPNKCTSVWDGEVLKAAFKDFRFNQADNDSAGKRFLQERGIGHYWDMAAAFDDTEALAT